MNIKAYIQETEKQYHLRLKTLVPLDDEAMDRLERSLAKYQPLSISRPSKTIMQRQPLDFPNVDSGEVFIVDMTLGMPAAPHVVRADVRKVLDAPENFVFVRNRNEPGEWQTELLNAVNDIEAEALRKGLVADAALTDADYNEAESPDHNALFGTEYNQALLGYLAAVEQERKDAIQRVTAAPFNWLDLPDRKDQEPVQDDADFNASVKDAPRVAPKPLSKPDVDGGLNVSTSVFGNLDAGARIIRKVYKDKKGKRVVLSRKLSNEEI